MHMHYYKQDMKLNEHKIFLNIINYLLISIEKKIKNAK